MLEEGQIYIIGAGLTIATIASAMLLSKASHIERVEVHFTSIDRVPKIKKSELPKRLVKTGIKKEASVIINQYLKTLKARPHIDLRGIYENFMPYCIDESKNVSPHYDSTSKKIFVDSNDFKNSLLRGLLDMTVSHEYEKVDVDKFGDSKKSSFKTDGFTRAIGTNEYSYEIGMGITEGYKDLLLERYFDVDYRYPPLANIVQLIEFEVGQELMESLFFQGNLRELLQIMNECEDKTWLTDIDKIFESLKTSPFKIKKNVINEYRQLLISLSRLAIVKGLKTYEGRYIDHWHMNSSQILDAKLDERVHGIRIISTVNSILREAKSSGILENEDAKMLAQYGNKILTPIPSSLRISI